MSSSLSSRGYNEEKNRDELLTQRAMRNPEVYRQLTESMEEDPDLVETYTKHLRRRFGAEWDKMTSTEQNDLIKKTIMLYRVPIKKSRGGKKTLKKKKSSKKKTKRNSLERKTLKTKKKGKGKKYNKRG